MRPEETMDEAIEKLGPLRSLVGTWEGDKGDDLAPDDDRTQVENNKYRERLVFEPTGQVNNHDQTLFGLRYRTTAWRLGEDSPFHEEVGYWLWDAGNKQILRCFIVPRGITVLAGGTAEADAKSFELAAELGSPTYGICSNQFLDREFKTVRYELKVTVHDDGSFSYDEDTQMQIPGQAEIFHHRDKNTVRRVDG